jgi:hypothetical protein
MENPIAFIGRLTIWLAVAASFSSAAIAQTNSLPDSSQLNAQASALDPGDYASVQTVCTVCHGPNMFFHSRTWPQWLRVFDQMRGNGAKATDDQWKHIFSYFQRALTFIDVNRADEDTLSLILGIDENTAVAMVARRADQKFKTIDELETVPGIDKERIEQMRPRILFERFPGEQ